MRNCKSQSMVAWHSGVLLAGGRCSRGHGRCYEELDCATWQEIRAQRFTRFHALHLCSHCALATQRFSANMPEEIGKVHVPIKDDKDSRGYRWDWIEFVEPYSLARHIWREAGLDGLDRQTVHDYWKGHLDRDAPWALHLERLLGEELYDIVPLGIYGDGCRIRHVTHQKPQKAFGLFMNCPLFRPYSSYASRWLLFSIDENLLYKHHTMNTVLARITWSCNLLFEDRFPSTGCWGQPLTPKEENRKGLPITGQKFVVCELRGDWKYVKDVWRVQSSWKAGVRNPVCFLCPAFGTGHSKYYNIKENSPLWAMQYSLTEFIIHQMPERGICCLVECFLFP